MTAAISEPIRCVAFDAVGTVIHAQPSVAKAYTEIGKRYGANLSIDVVRSRFQRLFAERQLELQTNEATELAFWREIVTGVLGAVDDFDSCFQELYDHFSHPNAWRVDPEVAELFDALDRSGLHIAIASNFDHRLNSVIEGHPELRRISTCCISAEIGWRKPSREFYHQLIARTGYAAGQILMVGDDLNNDVTAAINAGLVAIHFVPENARMSEVAESNNHTISSLREVLDLVRVQ